MNPIKFWVLCLSVTFCLQGIVLSDQRVGEQSGSEQFEFRATLEHLRSELYLANQRLNSIVDAFNKRILAMNADTMDSKATMSQIQSDVMQLQKTVSTLTPLLEQMKNMRNNESGSNNQIELKFQSLQNTVMDTVHQLQAKYIRRSSQLQEQLSNQQVQLSNQAESLTDISKKSADVDEKINEQVKLSSDIKQRLEAAEDKINVDPPYDVTIHRMKSLMNMLQNELVTTYRRSEDKASQLETQLGAIKEELEKLKVQRR